MDVAVEEHYTRRDLTEVIREALQQAGKHPAHLQPADLAAVDEFHIRGRQATLELASRIKPAATDRVLDIGSGLGGASCALAATYGCHVTGIDLTEEYCRTPPVHWHNGLALVIVSHTSRRMLSTFLSQTVRSTLLGRSTLR